MTQVSVELPEALTSMLDCAPDVLDVELRLTAATQWYQQGGRIFQEWAARIAGMDRTDFLLALARMGKSSTKIHLRRASWRSAVTGSSSGARSPQRLPRTWKKRSSTCSSWDRRGLSNPRWSI
jgi:hypothetical protein